MEGEKKESPLRAGSLLARPLWRAYAGRRPVGGWVPKKPLRPEKWFHLPPSAALGVTRSEDSFVCTGMDDERTTTPSQRTATIAFGLVAWLAFVPLFAGIAGLAGLAVILVAVVVAMRAVPGFWRLLAGSLAAGAIAGLVVLGPGLRLAMRVVAIVDPLRAPEFTLGGTVFLVVFLGVILGGILGLSTIFLREGLGWNRSAVSVLGAVAVLGIILTSPELRSELLELGLGALMNIPMFGLVGFLHGMALQVVFDRMKFARVQSAPPVEVMA